MSNALPEALETLRTALNEAAEGAAALEQENARLIGEVTALTEDVLRLRAVLDASKQDGGGQ